MPEQLPRLKFLHLFTGVARHSSTTTKILSKKKKAHTKRTQPPQSPSVLRLPIPTELPQNSKPNSKKTPHGSECRPPIACKVRRIFHSAARNSEAVQKKFKHEELKRRRRRWRLIFLEAWGGLIFAATAPAALESTRNSLPSKLLMAP